MKLSLHPSRRAHLAAFMSLGLMLSSTLFAEPPAPRPKRPIMGWSSWNHFRIHIDEALIREQADAMVASGMTQAGYRFVNIDDGFFGGRDGNGKLISHEMKFPSGMKSLADYIHSKGLKPGISADIEPTFESVMKIVDLSEPLWIHSGPGHFNDMDMLQVGRGMSQDEDRTHFTMWCMMNSPLLAGNDLRKMTPETIAILTHPEIIALNQDPLAYQARRLRDDGDSELWAKPLGKSDSGDVAVTLLNRSKEPASISFAQADRAASQSFTVPAHGVLALLIKGKSAATPVFAKASSAP